MSAFTDGFLKGFTGELGKGIRANEVEKLKAQRANALADKADSLAQFKAIETEKTAAATRTSQEKIASEKIKSAEKIAEGKAGAAAEKEKVRSRREGAEFAVSLGIDPETERDKFNRAVTLFVTGEMPEGEPEPEDKKWWQKLGDWFSGDGEEPTAPTVGAPEISPPAATPAGPPTVSGAPPPSPALDTQEKKPAPPKALEILKKNPSSRNIALFKRRFGYIPQEYKQTGT